MTFIAPTLVVFKCRTLRALPQTAFILPSPNVIFYHLKYSITQNVHYEEELTKEIFNIVTENRRKEKFEKWKQKKRQKTKGRTSKRRCEKEELEFELRMLRIQYIEYIWVSMYIRLSTLAFSRWLIINIWYKDLILKIMILVCTLTCSSDNNWTNNWK